jgi:hypothetical protein
MAAATAAAARLLLALAVLAACLGAAPRGADALRSLGVGGAKAADGDAAVDLDASNFTAFLQASPESFAVVEFFAHWSALVSDLIDSFLFVLLVPVDSMWRLGSFQIDRRVSLRVAKWVEIEIVRYVGIGIAESVTRNPMIISSRLWCGRHLNNI